jgi:cytochrome b involved in lipid metabolism
MKEALMDKRSVVFSSIILLLILAIGVGGSAIISNRQTQQAPKSDREQKTSFTMKEVAKHSTKDDCWTVISGDVYDVTKYVNRHPGGDEILQACGTDGTSMFTSRQAPDGQPVGTGTPHSETAREQLSKLKIGELTK